MLNWIDITIVAILLFYLIEGYALGALPALFDLLQFTISFFVGLKFYLLFAPLIANYTAIPQGIGNAIGFFLIAFLSETILHIIFQTFFKRLIAENFLSKPEAKRINGLLGMLPGILSGLVLVMFVITVVTALPVSPFLKKSVNESKIGTILLARAQLIEKQVNTIFGAAANDTINFLTVEPESNANVSLRFTYKNGTIDESGEGQMLLAVNSERTKAGLPIVTFNSALQQVARAHAQDMLQRGYFSHYNPEGLSPFDRLDNAHILYQAAGENLAFSPNVTIAMQGLMQSPGHRANILSKDFGKVGIGVIDAGIYGEMFVQEFTN